MAKSAIVKLRHPGPAIAVMAFAVVILLSFWVWLAPRELWVDQRLVQVLGAQPLNDLFRLLHYETSPPFVFVIAHVVQYVSSNEIVLKTTSLLPVLVSLILIVPLARRTIGSSGATATAAILAGAGLFVLVSETLRMHSWLLLWSTLTTSIVFRILISERTQDFVWLAIIHVLGLYTHYIYGVLAAALTIILFFRCRRRGAVAISAAIPILAFLPWFLLYTLGTIEYFQSVGFEQVLHNNRWENVLLPIKLFVPFYFLNGRWDMLYIFVQVSAWLLVASAVFGVRDRRGPSQEIRIALVICGIGIALLMVSGFQNPSYFVILAPALSLTMGYGLAQLPISIPGQVALGSALVIASLAIAVGSYASVETTYQREAATVARLEQPGDRILVYPQHAALSVQPYYRGTLEVVGFLSTKRPSYVDPIVDALRTNYLPYLSPSTIDRLSEYVNNASRVWVFYDVPVQTDAWRADLVNQWFLNHGYVARQFTEQWKRTPPLLFRYDRI